MECRQSQRLTRKTVIRSDIDHKKQDERMSKPLIVSIHTRIFAFSICSIDMKGRDTTAATWSSAPWGYCTQKGMRRTEFSSKDQKETGIIFPHFEESGSLVNTGDSGVCDLESLYISSQWGGERNKPSQPTNFNPGDRIIAKGPR
jgi:hypothetical protein